MVLFVPLCHYCYSCGGEFPILTELRWFINLYSYNYHSYCPWYEQPFSLWTVRIICRPAVPFYLIVTPVPQYITLSYLWNRQSNVTSVSSAPSWFKNQQILCPSCVSIVAGWVGMSQWRTMCQDLFIKPFIIALDTLNKSFSFFISCFFSRF